MRTLTYQNLGSFTTPQEVKDLRQSTFDYHKELGYPVVHKHRWNDQDLREGRAKRCPFHDELYGNDPTWDAVCFGTGYVGGFADSDIAFVTIQDTPTNVISVLPTGTLQMDQHPQVTAPWLPLMGDGDLIILADFASGTWDVMDTHERYVLREVNPSTMRGMGFRSRSTVASRYRVGQSAGADKLPIGHPLYEVPLAFNYNNVPPVGTSPGESDDEGNIIPGQYTEHMVGVRLHGDAEPFEIETERDIRIAVLGDNTETSRGVRVSGKPKGTIVNF